MARQWIQVTGAREHNLKNVNVKLPRNELTVITGLSGSGKSSLAFDTIYAEGQRKYVESLSAYARQFWGRCRSRMWMALRGFLLRFRLSGERRDRPRSIVATTTEIYDYLRCCLRALGKHIVMRVENR